MSFSRQISRRPEDERVVLEWYNLTYSTYLRDPVASKFMSIKYIEKNILKGLSGVAESGHLVAIMGPTGCGKTSLINVLAARVPNVNTKFVKLKGSIKVNNSPRDDDHFRRVTAYVTQVSLNVLIYYSKALNFMPNYTG
jgi:ABC-type multidrug transport system ATPase subunit